MSLKSLSSHSLEQPEASMDEAAPRPRLCHLKKWPDFQGYGFNLHAERTKLQQQIGKVDADSPAESAGLKEKDRIIEVNFVNISNENHQQVVKRIRNGLEIDQVLFPDQVVLLVLDPEADEYFKKINTVVRHDMPNVLKLETAERQKHEERQVVEEPVEGKLVEKPIEEHVDDQVKDNVEDQMEDKMEDLAEDHVKDHVEDLAEDHVEDQVEDQVEDHVEDHVEDQMEDQMEEKNNKKDDESFDQKDELVNNAEDRDVAKVSDLNNNEQVNKTATNSISSLINSQETSSLNKSKKSNNSSVSTSPVQSQNSTLNRSSNAFAKDEIFSIEEMHEIIESKRRETQSQSGVEFRHRPPRPPPPGAFSYRSSTISTFTQAEQLDRFLEMSAAEFKSYLKSKGRNDPRVMSLDMKRKHEIFQNM